MLNPSDVLQKSKWALLFLIFYKIALEYTLADSSLLSSSIPLLAEKSPIILSLGEQRLLQIPDLLRYSLGGASVRAQSLPRSLNSKSKNDLLLIKAIHPGPADLWVWKTDGATEHRTIRVEKLSSEEIKPSLARGLSRLDEAEILISGNGVILRGEIQSLAESARIHSLTEGFPQDVRDETVLAEALLDKGKVRLDQWILESGYRGKISVQRRNRTLFLIGSIEKAMEQTSIRKQVLALFPATQFQISTLPDDSPTIYFRVFLLELKKDRFHSFGLSWPPTQESAFRVTSSGLQNLLQLDLALHQLEGEGSVKVLSNPELAVRVPGEAELFSGGELPIHTQSQFHSNVSWKNFGLTLKLKVTHNSGEKIRLEIQTEVSSLDSSIADHQIPGIQANRMKTQVDATYGTPLLLSGLLQQGIRQQARGLPLLRQIPILGALLGSEDYLNERSELVAILLPMTTLPVAPMDRVLSKDPFPKVLHPSLGNG